MDERTRDEIVSDLEDLWRNRGLTRVIVTHDSHIAQRAQRIAVITGARVSAGHPAVTARASRTDPRRWR